MGNVSLSLYLLELIHSNNLLHVKIFLFAVDRKIMLTILPIVLVMFGSVGVVICCMFCNNKKKVKYHRRFIPHTQHAYNRRYSRRRMYSQSTQERTYIIPHSKTIDKATSTISHDETIGEATSAIRQSKQITVSIATIPHSENTVRIFDRGTIGEITVECPHREYIDSKITAVPHKENIGDNDVIVKTLTSDSGD